MKSISSPGVLAAAQTRGARLARAVTSLRHVIGERLPTGIALGGPRAGLAFRLPAGANPERNAHAYAGSAGRRDYELFVPSGYRGAPLPLIVMLHGCTQSAADFAAGTQMNAAAERAGCFVAYPVQPSSANPAKCWNWFEPRDQQRDRGEPSLVVGIVRKIAVEYAIDASRVYVAGLSAGGAAAAVLGMEYPDVFAAVGIHSGLACGSAHDTLSALAAMRGAAAGSRPASARRGARQSRTPTIVFHGDRDATVHASNSDRIVASSAAHRLSAKKEVVRRPGRHAATRTVYADRDGNGLLETWTVHGAGHAWSGGSELGSFTDPGGPDATGEMLRFFLAHRLESTTTSGRVC